MNIKEKLKQKLNSRSGFTLTEMLLATIILLLVSLIVATGIPVAREAYEKVVLASNADIILSTTISSFRNELGMAYVEPEIGSITALSDGTAASNTIIYYNVNRGAYSALFIAPDGYGNNTIFLQRYTGYDPINKVIGATGIGFNSPIDRLIYIAEKDAKNHIYVTFQSATPDDATNPQVITFNYLKVMHGADVIASRDKVSIRVVPK